MSLYLQRLVSGKKARWQEDGVDLDLVYVLQEPPKLIICGLPSSGVTALYRNPRKTVRDFLERRHGSKYHIFNLCPTHENAYDASYFHDQVSRFPFPDHHPPPLSLIPLFVRRISHFHAQDSDNVAVIHCKAGKGRSGTMTCCYLLTLPNLPGSATVSRKASLSSRKTSSESGKRDGEALLNRDNAGKLMGKLHEVAPHPALDRISTPQPSQNITPDMTPPESPKDMGPADAEVAGIGDQLAYIFSLHTKQRMKADSGKKGVSIPSQRRFVAYWWRILQGDDPRSMSPKSRKLKITSIDVSLSTGGAKLAFILARNRLNVAVSTYLKDYTANLRRWEQELKAEPDAIRHDYAWADDKDLIESCDFGFVEQAEAERDEGAARHLALLKHHDAADTLLDVDREIQLKILIGKTGNKHSRLPDVASLGYIWLVPAFEADTGVWTFDSTEIDFLKPPVASVQVHYEMVDA